VCFDLDSSPPIPPVSGAALTHEDLVLEAADGNRFAAFAAMPDAPTTTGVVVLPDVRGLYRFYEEVALRFAERDIAAIALDYFGRTAGIGKRDDDFPYPDHVQQTTWSGVTADVAAAVAWLRNAGAQSVFTVGFCFGGRCSWLSTGEEHDLAGAVGFYGSLGDRGEWRGPISRAAELKGPIVALQAGGDENITADQNAAFDEALTDAGVEHEIVTYDGAPHSFFDRKQEQYQAASDDAWARTLAFIERHS
jgi:carboxymethylenebutenolidase